MMTMYERWLIDCVFFRGWTTLKCAKFLNENDPEKTWLAEAILDDFNKIVTVTEGNGDT